MLLHNDVFSLNPHPISYCDDNNLACARFWLRNGIRIFSIAVSVVVTSISVNAISFVIMLRFKSAYTFSNLSEWFWREASIDYSSEGVNTFFHLLLFAFKAIVACSPALCTPKSYIFGYNLFESSINSLCLVAILLKHFANRGDACVYIVYFASVWNHIQALCPYQYALAINELPLLVSA